MSVRTAILVSWVVAGILLAIAPGCADRAPEPEPAAGVTVTAQDTRTGVTVTAEIDRTAIRTVDRLGVEVRVVRPAGLAVELLGPDLGETDWTLVERTAVGSSVTADGRIEDRTAFTLEPFLDGSYRVPGFEAVWGAEDDRRSVRTEPVAVEVTSVLGEEAGALADALAPVAPAEDASPRTGLLIGAGVVVLGAVLILWRMTRPRDAAEPRHATPVERLRAVASGREDDADLSRVHRALADLTKHGDNGREDGGLQALRERCERLRFGGGRAGAGEAREIARSALSVVEVGA